MMKLMSKATKVVVSAGLLAVMLAAFTPVAQALPAAPPSSTPTQLELLAKAWRATKSDGGDHLLTLRKDHTFAWFQTDNAGASSKPVNGTYTFEGGKLTLTAYDGTVNSMTVVPLVKNAGMITQDADGQLTWTALGAG